MKKIQRDTTKDLFLAVLKSVKENGHYAEAEKIMDYYLPNYSEYDSREDIELSAYEFDFEAMVKFGSNEGIYISCYIHGKYTEKELMLYNHDKGTMEPETKRHIGTFKTLRDDVESMKIMGELCGALVFYAHKYVNENLDRYTPAYEVERRKRYKNCNSALNRYTDKLTASTEPDIIPKKCEECPGDLCAGKQGGCIKGLKRFIRREISKHSSHGNYRNKEHDPYCDFLDSKYDITEDNFENYADILAANFLDLTVYQTAGYVYTWLNTRKQNFICYFTNADKSRITDETVTMSYESLNDYEKKKAFNMVKAQLLKEFLDNNGDIEILTEEKILYYVKDCVYYYETGSLQFVY